MMGPQLDELLVADRVFQLYVQRVFRPTVFKKQRMDLSNYRYVPFAHILAVLADRLRNQHQAPRDRRLPSFYALQILDGHYQQDFRECFEIPVINSD